MYVLDEQNSDECLLTRNDEAKLWHKRLGHICNKNLAKLCNWNGVRDVPDVKRLRDEVCDSCQKGKQTVVHHNLKEFHSERPLELIHTDLCGPMRTQATNGEYYFMLFIDDFTRMTWVSFLKKKDETLECLKIFRREIENFIGKRIRSIRADQGSEFT